jgi:hypothetical protein
MSIKHFNIFFFWCIFSITLAQAQVEKAKAYINSAMLNCDEALKETNSSLLYLDSLNLAKEADGKTKEKWIRFSESESVNAKRLTTFSEDNIEKALKIIEDDCESASNPIADLLLTTPPILIKIEDANIQFTMWLNEKEMRETIDFLGSAHKNLEEAKERIVKVSQSIKSIQTILEKCH